MLSTEQQEFLKSLLSRARVRTGLQTFRPVQNRTFVDEQRSGAGPDERDPAKLAGLIDKMIINKGWDLQLATGKLRAQWIPIVGQDVAAHVEIEEFKLDPSGQSGTLILRADSTAWSTQMKLLLATLQNSLEKEIGVGRLSEIKVLGPNAPSWKHGLRSVPGRGPRDTYG
jgi:predicted nucleic acid-binding Zn ribbon protein